jgi:hypothetical protein
MPAAKGLTTPQQGEDYAAVLDLSDSPEELDASTKGLVPRLTGPPHDHVRTVALRLLLIFGICLFAILILATLVAWFSPGALKDIIGFFGTVVATLGTLLGGVVAFYFTRR